MKYLSLTIIVILQLCFILGCSASSAEENQEASSVQSNSQSNSQIKSQNNIQSDVSMPLYFTLLPLTSDYYNQFMNSQIDFPRVLFEYSLQPMLDYPVTPNKDFIFQSKVEVISGQYTDFTLSQIDEFSVFYHDLDDHPLALYEGDLESSWIMPVFDLIQENSDYYFSGDEFGEEESVKFSTMLQFGYKNFIHLAIQTPNQDTDYHNPYYAFCKGWHPDEDPPEEVLPLINYIENVLMPEMLNHPFTVQSPPSN